jgi:hypothetical protein
MGQPLALGITHQSSTTGDMLSERGIDCQQHQHCVGFMSEVTILFTKIRPCLTMQSIHQGWFDGAVIMPSSFVA